MNSTTKHLSIAGVLTLLTTAVVYVLISGRFSNFAFFQLPTQASAEGVIIDNLMDGHFILMSFLFAIIVAPSSYAFYAFRRRQGDETDAPHIHENTVLEIGWTVAPIILVVGFAIWGVQAYTQVLAFEPTDRIIRAQAYKWDWSFYYPELDNQVSASLVLEVNQPVKLEMQSTDIIHAFWVPEFRVKQDVVPLNPNDPRQSFRDTELYDPEAANYTPTVLRITPTQTGVYRVRCAEICGTNHYGMLAHVHVLDAADYQAWLNGELILPTDPGVGNTQQIKPDGRVNESYYIPELAQYCQTKYGNPECIGN